MAAPLRSANPGQQKSMQFAHFGVLDAGAQSRASTITSLVLNLAIAFVVIVISAATARRTIEKNRMLTNLVAPVVEKKAEPVKPKVIPPKPKPLPQIAKVEPPKITIPQVKLPELPKQPIVKMDNPTPLITPPAPKKIVAMAAPIAVNLGARPQAASVVNNDPHPTAVQIGHPDMPFKDPKGPAVASVNLNSGFSGMNAANSGHGPAATKVNMGNGSPDSTTIHGNGVVAVAGIPHGVPNSTGTGRVPGGQQVSLGVTPPPATPKPAAVASTSPGKAVTVISKPKPEYTAEARQMHIEGVVVLHIRVLANGEVEVVGVAKPLGYGLDDSAKRAIMATKFQPATDSTGHAITWEGNVNVTFQLAG
jgi:periplasmic protein TonB